MANTEPLGLRASPLVPPPPKVPKVPKVPKGSTNSNQWHHPSISANPTYHIISYFIPNYPFLPSKICKGFIITNSIGKTILQLTVLVGKQNKKKNKKKKQKNKTKNFQNHVQMLKLKVLSANYHFSNQEGIIETRWLTLTAHSSTTQRRGH